MLGGLLCSIVDLQDFNLKSLLLSVLQQSRAEELVAVSITTHAETRHLIQSSRNTKKCAECSRTA